MCDLPLEILVRILGNLGCIEITRMSRVCQLWKDIIQQEPSISRVCFKRSSAAYFDEGTEPGQLPVDNCDTRIRFHPAMARITYRMGETLSTVHLRGHDANTTPLIKLPLQHDFATIPATSVMDIEVKSTSSSRKARGMRNLTISVSNPNGVRLGDIFLSIVTESMERCDLVAYASGGRISNHWMSPALTFHKKAEILGNHKSYAGIKCMTIENGKVKVEILTEL